MCVEIEIKLTVDNVRAIRTNLREFGWRITTRRKLEVNWVLDSPDESLRRNNRLLRVRQSGSRSSLTVKHSPIEESAYKIRKEFETELPHTGSILKILGALGYQIVWRYEKYRTEFSKKNNRGAILLDETPIGNFLELEGEATWIDKTTAKFGFTTADYITDSYRTLFEKSHLSTINTDMLFSEQKSLKNTP